MRNLLILGLITIGLSFGLNQVANAVCVQNGNTPEGGNIINCPAPVQNTPLNLVSAPNTTNLADEVNIPEGGGLNVGVGSAIVTDDGNDRITTSGDVTGDSQAIFSGNDDDTITVNGGTLIGINSQAIFSGSGADIITINGGFLEGGTTQAIFSSSGDDIITVNAGTLVGDGSQAIFTSSGNDTVIVNGGTLDASNTNTQIIFTSSDNDTVILNGGTYLKGSDEVIFLSSGNDSLTFGGDIDLDGFVDCGSDFDTLVFAMDVPQEAVVFISSQILAQNPQNGSVVINDINYEWENCELLVPDLNGVQIVRPIPTLSEWGLIAMAGVLGIVGLLAVRRKTVSA